MRRVSRGWSNYRQKAKSRAVLFAIQALLGEQLQQSPGRLTTSLRSGGVLQSLELLHGYAILSNSQARAWAVRTHTRTLTHPYTHTVFNRFLLKLFSTSSNFLDVFWAVYSNLCAVEKHCHGLSTCPRLTVTSMSKFCLPHLVPFCKIIHCCTWMGKIYHKLRKHTLSRME